MMRLTKVPNRDHPDSTVWMVEGRIGGEYALLLREEYRALSSEERERVCVDLTEVSFVDEQGVEVLREIERGRGRVQGARGFVKEILKSSTLHPEITPESCSEPVEEVPSAALRSS